MPIAVLSSARGEQCAIGPRSRFKLPIIFVEAFSLLNVSLNGYKNSKRILHFEAYKNRPGNGTGRK
jgi:hypothetical protein